MFNTFARRARLVSWELLPPFFQFRPHLLLIIQPLPNHQPPPSTPSKTPLKTRPKVSRRVHLVPVNSLASYSPCFPCLFALVDRALGKPICLPQPLLNHFNLLQNLKTCLALPYSDHCFGPSAPGQTFDISPLGPQHSWTRGAVSLPPILQNGRFTSSLPLLHKLSLQGSFQAKARSICCSASIHYRWLRGRVSLDVGVSILLTVFQGLVNRRNRRGFHQLWGIPETVSKCVGFLSIALN